MGMNRNAKYLILGAALLAPLLVLGDEYRDSDDQHRFAAGVRFGIFPPVLSALELAIRPLSHLALNAYGIYLPNGVGLGNGGRRLTFGGNLTLEMAKGRRSGGYASVGAVYYHAFEDVRGFYETWATLPL